MACPWPSVAVVLGAVVLACAGCGDDQSTGETVVLPPPDGPDRTTDAAAPLDQPAARREFCRLAVEACTSVALAECEQIVEDAGRFVRTIDLPCVEDAQSCEDTEACLAELPILPGQDEPTTMEGR